MIMDDSVDGQHLFLALTVWCICSAFKTAQDEAIGL